MQTKITFIGKLGIGLVVGGLILSVSPVLAKSGVTYTSKYFSPETTSWSLANYPLDKLTKVQMNGSFSQTRINQIKDDSISAVGMDFTTKMTVCHN